MPRRLFNTTALLLVMLVPTVGCLFRSHSVPKRTTLAANRTATLAELVQMMNQQAAAIKTMNLTVDIDTSVGGSKKGKVTEFQEIRGYILVRKPEQLRMIGLLPIVRNRAFDMVSNGANGFKLYIPAKNKFVVGPADVTTPSQNSLENLRPNVLYDAILLQPVDPENEIAVLENSAEVVTDQKKKTITEEPTYVLDIVHRGPQGWYLSRKVVFSRADLLVHKQIIYDKSAYMATEARYDDFKTDGGVQFPWHISIWRPQEEYEITVGVVKATFNEPLKDEQFALAQPPGAQVVDLGNPANNKPANGGDGEKK